MKLRTNSHSHLTKAGPQASVGKANQNFVKFWCEAKQTGFARLSWDALEEKRRKTPLVSPQRELTDIELNFSSRKWR